MPEAIGILLALMMVLFTHAVKLDSDRAFYPTILMVIASYYVLFAVIGGTSTELLVDTVFYGLFAMAAVAGFRRSLWIVVVGLALHGVFDFLRPLALPQGGVPHWWPPFCAAFDVTAAAALATLLLTKTGARRPA